MRLTFIFYSIYFIGYFIDLHSDAIPFPLPRKPLYHPPSYQSTLPPPHLPGFNCQEVPRGDLGGLGDPG